MARKFITLLLIVFLVFISYQVYKLYKQKKQLQDESEKITADLVAVRDDNKKLQADIEYFQRPENLEKELKSRFNYVKEGERMMIIVPKKTTNN